MIIKEQIKHKKEFIKACAIEATKQFFDHFNIRLEQDCIANEILNYNRAIIVFHPTFVIKEHTALDDGTYEGVIYDEPKRDVVDAYLLKKLIKNIKKLIPKEYKAKFSIPDMNKKGRLKNNELFNHFGIEGRKADHIRCVIKLAHR